MRRGRRLVPQRAPYFVGCEGDSERAYVTLLNRIAGRRGLYVSLHGELLKPGAGDPLAIVRLAVQSLKRPRHRDTRYRHVAILLDEDKGAESPDRTTQAVETARQHDIDLVWQRPNFEAVLLRHLDGCESLRPPADRSLAELRRHWPEYDKRAISADKLERRIDWARVAQAARVEAELSRLLARIGLI